MGNSVGSSSTTSTQPYILSGPTLTSAAQAAQAQIQAAQQAAQAVETSTNSAISALMGEYNTSLQVANPGIQLGNQAAYQYNYMLGLPAINPGAAPTAPTPLGPAPTAPDTSPQAVFNALQSMGGRTDQQGKTYSALQTIAQQPLGGSVDHAMQLMGLSPSQDPSLAQLQNLAASNPGAYSQLANTVQDPGPYKQAMAQYQQQQDQFKQEEATYQQQLNQYNQQQNLYNQYNAKGVASPQDISNIVSNLPGFQFNQQQGISAIQNAASASGQLNSGNLLESLNQFGQGLAENYYQNYMGNLMSQMGYGQQSTGQAVGASQNLGNNIAGLYSNLGSANANSALAQGQAMASSYLLPVDNQKVNFYPYTTTSSTNSSSDSFGAGGLLSGIGAIKGLFPSSKQLKEDYQTINTEEILSKINQLDIEKWKYKGINNYHLGPYAEQFKELFGVGDGESINMIDMFGVLLSSVKELSIKLKNIEEGLKNARY